MNHSSGNRDALVSVAVPVFNGQATVGQALQSLLSQTYRNLEIIVVDDGSTDGTWDVLQSFGSSIRAIRQANGGLAAARNAGLQAATGEFIALMDADDLCEPDRIAAQVQFLRQCPELSLCCSDFGAFSAEGQVSHSHIAAYYSRCNLAEGGVAARFPHRGSIDLRNCLPRRLENAAEVPIYFGAAYEDISLGNFVHPPTVMFRRSLIKEVGSFDLEAKTMCDWDWLVRVARVSAIGFIDRPLLQYRLSASQMSATEFSGIDSLLVARRICERDPTLIARWPKRFRQRFGRLSASVADSLADKRPLQAASLLTASIFRYRTWTRQTPRTLFKILAPEQLVRLLRRYRTGKLHST
ncbi:MAG: glycosyltransferase [Burkholderiaceae bacterium]